jgi:hypothetical protein
MPVLFRPQIKRLMHERDNEWQAKLDNELEQALQAWTVEEARRFAQNRVAWSAEQQMREAAIRWRKI